MKVRAGVKTFCRFAPRVGQGHIPFLPACALGHTHRQVASGSKLGLDATKERPCEGFTRPWPPLSKMDATVKAKVENRLD